MKNILQQKSASFSLQLIELSNQLRKSKDLVFADEILRSGLSIGQNIENSRHRKNVDGFISTLSDSYSDAKSTEYWLQLLKESKKLPTKEADSIISSLDEIQKILYSSISTAKKNQKEKIETTKS